MEALTGIDIMKICEQLNIVMEKHGRGKIPKNKDNEVVN
jgi:hypothetical protein